MAAYSTQKIFTRAIAIFALVAFSLSYCQAQSILKDNSCFKVSVEESGIYKISYEDLKKWGFDDVSQIAIYGNGAGELPLLNTTEIPDTLHEISIKIHKGSNGVFNAGDYILFYAQSPDTWTFSEESNTFTHKKHTFDSKNYYYIVSRKAEKEIVQETSSAASPTKTITSYDYLQFYESNETAPLNTGRNRFESIASGKTISFPIPNVLTEESATLEIAAAARHSSTAIMNISANQKAIGSISFSSTTSNKPYARLQTKTFSFLPSTNNTISITLNYSGANSRGYLDYCTLHSRCKLAINNNEQLIFRDAKSIGSESVRYEISTKKENSVWNITDPENPIEIATTYSNNKTSFVHTGKTNLQEFISFSDNYKNVTAEGFVDNQDILSSYNVDMIIISNDIFKSYAEQMAELHQKNDKFSTIIVSQEEICNEFSAGRKDVTSIRNYLRYVYLKSNKKLKYVLLFGDGTFKNETIELNGPHLFTFQTFESLNEDNSLCSDDFFALLDNGEGVKDNDIFVGEMDIAIGRFPVSTKTEAENITYKNIQYATNPLYRGDWQNYLCFLADDANENQTIHMSDADQLCKSISQNYPQFNFDKIYADAYQQIISSAGERYPDVVEAINNRIQKGCLIFNYSGHGNETRMMAEYAVEASSIESWKNTTKLPFFIGAACNIAHFDYDGQSIGEKILVQKDGGGIGMISATRYSYASANYTLCNNIYKTIFSLDSLQQIRTIGESFILAKASTSNDYYQNKRIYTLLGDPALRLAIPLYSVVVDSINSINVSAFNDTIKALSTLTIAGHIEKNANLDKTYDGTLYIKLFDKSQSITTLGNDGNDVFTFDSYSNILFQGLADVKDGHFSFSAKIPQDILYYTGKGKLSLYAINDDAQAAGAYLDLIINGSTDSNDDDFIGPEVSIYFNDTTFVNGSTTNQNPTILIFVKDSSGINISDASIGHNIVLTIDDDISNQIILNDFYYSDLNTFISGSIKYTLHNLEEGEHTISLTIYDSYNNVSETEISFTVCNSKNIKLTKLYNYPNPMKDISYFHFEHNQAGNEMKVTIRISDIAGNIVRVLSYSGTPNGFLENSLYWDGKNSHGVRMSQGVYPYTIEIQTNSGEKIYGEQKILLMK
ncbi:MAG: type IX secretion system sortase PorU [Bacteroidales bacterium]|nr:type IX secretion system sortase PorU [Bacteroidales bacterium]